MWQSYGPRVLWSTGSCSRSWALLEGVSRWLLGGTHPNRDLSGANHTGPLHQVWGERHTAIKIEVLLHGEWVSPAWKKSLRRDLGNTPSLSLEEDADQERRSGLFYMLNPSSYCTLEICTLVCVCFFFKKKKKQKRTEEKNDPPYVFFLTTTQRKG